MGQSRVTLVSSRQVSEGTFELRLERYTGASHGKMWGKTIPGRRAAAPNKLLSHEKSLHIQGTESNFPSLESYPNLPQRQ